MLLVDGVSSIGALDFQMDEWKVDVALTGSQKALSLPTGLGIVCASPRALEAAKTAKSLRVFFDWADYLKFYKLGSIWPYTPSSQMLYGLRASLDLILKEEGLQNVIARHHRLGEATRYCDSVSSSATKGRYTLVQMTHATCYAEELQEKYEGICLQSFVMYTFLDNFFSIGF